jgi:acetyltransferase-like isoleucine patch superfamily enzyme
MATVRTHTKGAGFVEVGDRTYVGAGTIIGGLDNPTSKEWRGIKLTWIGSDCSIGNYCTISENVMIGDRVKIGNNVVIRSGVRLANDCVVGHGTVFEGDAVVGEDTLIHAQCHITKGAKIGERVFIAPYFVGANDPICMRRKFMKGQPEFVPVPYEIGDDVRVGIGAVILPGVKVGDGALIAAGSIVTRDVAAGTRVMGIPARVNGVV